MSKKCIIIPISDTITDNIDDLYGRKVMIVWEDGCDVISGKDLFLGGTNILMVMVLSILS